MCFGCSKYANPQDTKQKVIAAPPDSTLAPVMEGIIAYPSDSIIPVVTIKLTWDKVENLKRIKAIPGYDTLSPEKQEKLTKMLLLTVPDSILDKKISKPNHSSFLPDTCITGYLNAANCPAVIITYHMHCPPGLVLNETNCYCQLPENAPEGSSNCYTLFQFSQTGSGHLKLVGGHWALTAIFGYPGWCKVNGCTLHQ